MFSSQTTTPSASRPAFRWAGFRLLAIAAAVAWLPGTIVDVQGGPPEATAEIRIALPGGAPPRVSVSPGRERVVLDLPRGARYPRDFVTSSGGMLRDGKVEFDEQRVRIELELALGTLERVDFESDAVVLKFRGGHLPPIDIADPQQRYVLGPDDRIAILVHNHEELSPELDITREGWITAPLVGQVKAAGLTPPQLAAKLAGLLANGYLTDPQVDVSVKEYRSQWVVVSGEVTDPGRKPLRGGTRLKEVLGEAAGFTKEAGEEITITRKVPGSEETRTLFVSRTEFERGRSNPSLSHGDTIDIRRAEYCYIQGEVRRSGRVRIERGMTLLRVIALAEGLTDWANRKEVVVLYPDGTVPRERTYNLKKIEKGAAEDPVIVGGEDIIVKQRFL
jgi:polysaccharide export outer membrane protein